LIQVVTPGSDGLISATIRSTVESYTKAVHRECSTTARSVSAGQYGFSAAVIAPILACAR
jgi:hypothetical protein